MKKLFLFIPFVLFANQALPMPPMPPMMNLNTNKTKKLKKKKEKNNMPKACETIPPMIIFLPPPLEKSLEECKNELFKPKMDYAKKVFAKKHLKVYSIDPVSGFAELYKIKTNKGIYYCNKDLSKCFKVSK